MDIALLKGVTEEFAAYLSEVTADDLTASTPCELWSIEDLFRHAVEENIALGRAVDPTLPPPEPRGGWVPGELTFRDSARYAMDALANAGERTGDDGGLVSWGGFGKLSPRELSDLHLAMTLLHTWDLAKASGFDFDPPSDEVTGIALSSLRGLPADVRGTVGGRSGLTGDEPFAPIVDFPAHSELDELLVLSGRSPAWPF